MNALIDAKRDAGEVVHRAWQQVGAPVSNRVARFVAPVSRTISAANALVNKVHLSTPAACGITATITLTMLYVGRRSFMRMLPRRRFLIELEAREMLSNYFDTGNAAEGDDDDDEDDGDAGMLRFPSSTSHVFSNDEEAPAPVKRSHVYLKCDLATLCTLCATARTVGCSSDVIRGLEEAVVEQCRRRVSSEAEQLPLNQRDAETTLQHAARAGVTLPDDDLAALKKLKSLQDGMGRSFLKQLLTRLLTEGPRGGASNPRQVIGVWAALFAAQVVDTVVRRALSSLLSDPVIALSTIRDFLPQRNGFLANVDGLQVASDVAACVVPLVMQILKQRVTQNVEQHVHTAVFAKFAATDQAVLDLTSNRNQLLQELTTESNNVQNALAQAPEILGTLFGTGVVFGICLYRRELPLFAIGAAVALMDYDRIRAMWETVCGQHSTDEVSDFLESVDQRPMPQYTERLGMEVLLAASATTGPRCRAPALATIASTTMWSSSLGLLDDGVTNTEIASVLRSFAAASTTDSAAAGLALFVSDTLDSRDAATGIDPATQRAIDEMLDDEEKEMIRGSKLQRIPLLPLSEWDASSFLTLRQLGMEVTMATRAYIAQQQESKAEAQRELATSLSSPHSSVVVQVLCEWRSYAAALAAHQALLWFPSLVKKDAVKPSEQFRSVGLVTAEFLDGPLRYVSVYEAGVEEAKQGLKKYRKLARAARVLSAMLGGLRVTIDIDPTLSTAEQEALRARQLVINDTTFQRGIHFRNVHFAYPVAPTHVVLKGLSFTLPKGQITGIIGPTGGGKSTVFKLLKRLYHPLFPGATAADVVTASRSRSNHSVYIDDTIIDKFNAQQLRCKIALVPQHPLIVDGTSFTNNIAMGHPCTDEQVIVAAKRARCHDFIMSKPKGYETSVRGSNLSGGERQRIAIARALVREPDILLLDEATSALDVENEQFIFEALNEFSKGRTIVMIAHRLATLRTATHIVVVEGGVCTEEGTPKALYDRPNPAHPSGHSLYRRYVDHQRLDDEPEPEVAAPAAATDAKEEEEEAVALPQATTPPPAAAAAAPVEGSDKDASVAAIHAEIAALRALGLGSEVDACIQELEAALQADTPAAAS